MGTATLWNKGDVLPRHGHPLQDPDKYQWHFASQFHPSHPYIHETHQSFTQPNWSRNNGDHFTLDQQQRDDMVATAKSTHDTRAIQAGYPPSAPPEPAQTSASPAAPTHPGSITMPPTGAKALSEGVRAVKEAAAAVSKALDGANLPPPAPTQAPAPVGLEDLATRIDDAESLALLSAEKAEQAERVGNEAKREAQYVAGRIKIASDQLEAATLKVPEHARQVAQRFVEPIVATLRQDVADLTRKVNEVRRVEYVITHPNGRVTTTPTGRQHRSFEKLLRFLTRSSQHNVWLCGPAGSGKSTAAEEIAKLLSLPFKTQPAVMAPHELLGFMDGYGKYSTRAFRIIYEHGGVMLLDECDSYSPAAMLALNGALANRVCSFPDAMVPRHPDCYIIAVGNTWGLGADAAYVGRNKLDATSLDRFVTLNWDYDEDFERHLALDIYPDADLWVDIVQSTRHAFFNAKGQGIAITPRASIEGASLLSQGEPPCDVVEAIFGRYRSHSMWPSIGRIAEEFSKLTHYTPSPSELNKPRDKAAELMKQYGGSSNGAATALPTVDFSLAKVYGRER